MAKNESKEVAVKEKAQVSTLGAELAAEYEFSDQFNFRDLIIPKILTMQMMSKLVGSDDAKAGDIVDTALNEAIGSMRDKDKKPVRFYPVQMFRYWVHRENDADGNPKFIGATPWTPGNAEMDWDRKNDAGNVIGSNEETLVFSVVREDQVEDLDQPPRLLSFRKTSLKAAKSLKNHFFMCKTTRKEVPFQTLFELSGKTEENDKGKWYVPEVTQTKNKASEEVTMLLMASYKRYGKAITEKIAGLLDEDETAPATGEREVGVTAEQGVAKF